MNIQRPEVFISATSVDLGTCRQIVKEALLTLGCTPVEQRNFPPEATSVLQMLRRIIQRCHAVVHIAGVAYGSEPLEQPSSQRRRSYTQMEYDVARELGKPVYVFICGEDFPYDQHPDEDDARRELQRAHRLRLQGGDLLFTPVASRDELAIRVSQLQTAVESLARQLRHTRSWLGAALAVGVVLLTLGIGGLYLLREQGRNTEQRVRLSEQRVAAVETELDRQRQYVKAVADVFSRQQAELAGLRLTDQQKFDRAIAYVASDAGLSAADLRARIELFAAAVQADPKADFYDRALADFARRNFRTAADNAGQAAQRARQERLAAEAFQAAAQAAAQRARRLEREALSLQAQSLSASAQYEASVKACEEAIAITPRQEFRQDWANLRLQLASIWGQWAYCSEGKAIVQRRAAAVEAYRSVLEVVTRDAKTILWAQVQIDLSDALYQQSQTAEGAERSGLLELAELAVREALQTVSLTAHPKDWIIAQNRLGIVLLARSNMAQGKARIRLLGDAVQAYQAVPREPTRHAFPEEWAMTRFNFGLILHAQARMAQGQERLRLLSQAVGAFLVSLEVFDSEVYPEVWALVQSNIGLVSMHKAMTMEGEDRSLLLASAEKAFRGALRVYTRESMPQDWARTQCGLCATLREQAKTADPRQRAQVLSQVVESYRSVLQVYKRELLPESWALAQHDLGSSLGDLALVTATPQESLRLTEQAAEALRSALQVYTRDLFPHEWARGQTNIARTLYRLCVQAEGDRRIRLLEESSAASRSALEVLTPQSDPYLWAMAQSSLAVVLAFQALAQEEPRSGFLKEASDACDLALKKIERDDFPEEWGMSRMAFAMLAFRRVGSLPAKQQAECLEGALQALRQAASVFTAQSSPALHRSLTATIADLESEIARLKRELAKPQPRP